MEKISAVKPKQSKFFYIVSNVHATTNKHHFTSKHTKWRMENNKGG